VSRPLAVRSHVRCGTSRSSGTPHTAGDPASTSDVVESDCLARPRGAYFLLLGKAAAAGAAAALCLRGRRRARGARGAGTCAARDCTRRSTILGCDSQHATAYAAAVRLLSLDYDPVYGDDETARSSFAGDTSVFDYDVVIWDPIGSFSEYVGEFPKRFQNLPSLPDSQSIQILSDTKRRRAEFTEFVNSGRTLLIPVSPPLECYIHLGKKTYSGTGKNRVTTRHVEIFDLLAAVPSTDFNFSRASGDRIEYVGDGPIIRVLRKYKNIVGYNAVIKAPHGSVIARVAGTDRVVGAIQRSERGGHLILLPSVGLKAGLTDDEVLNDESPWLKIAPEFHADLREAIEQLHGHRTAARPPWVGRFATQEQQELRTQVLDQQARVEAARAELAELQTKQESAEAKDQLFLGTGRALELEVKAVLELLGGVVTEPSVGRDDWRVHFPEGEAVVEVKGVGKSGAEKHSAQLEKWVANSLEESGVNPKGILVVNTFREKPLDERTEDDFPAQMLPYSKSRNHCLATGLQLFIMRSQIESGSLSAEQARRTLLETVGVLTGYEEWRTVLHETNQGE
jgi:hypothetical protein